MHPETAASFVKAILTASWQGTLVLLLILALRPLLGRRVPARWRYLLWTFVLVRLLVPSFILPPSPASLQNIPALERPAEGVTIAIDKAYTDYLMGDSFGATEAKSTPSTIPAPLPVSRPPARPREVPWWQVGAAVWMAGAVLLAAWILGATLWLHRRMRGEDTAVNEAIAAIWASCCERFSLARPPRLLVVRWIGSPALVGVFRTTLLIPAKTMETFSREDWEHIFMHELAHYRRRDHWMNTLQLVALCAHWFNPLVWLGFRFLRADRELAADELALERLTGDRAMAYGDTLLKVLSAHSTAGFQPGMIGIMDDRAQLKQRLRRIVGFGPSRMIGSVAGLGLAFALSLVVLGRASNVANLSAYSGMKPAELLVTAAARNDLPVLRKMLDDGIDINSIADLPGEKTALAAAAAANRMEAVRFLVTKGAAIDSAKGKPSPALMAALEHGRFECANYLLAKGATCDPLVLVDAKQDVERLKTGTYLIPTSAERGQILDRNGKTLAANRFVSNLGIVFPVLSLPDADALAFAHRQIATAQRIIPRNIGSPISDEVILRHYKSRGMLPLDIIADLTKEEQASLQEHPGSALVVHPVALRHYPNGTLGAHLLGYVARDSGINEPMRANKVTPGEIGGRAGLEFAFNDELAGKPGSMLLGLDAQGRTVSEKISLAPQPGNNVVTTIDADLQSLCEKVLKEGGRTGAIVILDPNNGDVLAMATWPTFDPNVFIPTISLENWKALTEDPRVPMINHASQAYPPGSTFKLFTGIAALESGAIELNEKIANPAFIQLDDYTFQDAKNADRGMLNFAEALEQNADTWFYQVGIKTGPQPIVNWALKFGFSKHTGIPLLGDSAGLLPTDEWLKKNEQPKWVGWTNGRVARLGTGQGYLLVTPIQMARAMATLASGGTVHQTRLVKQIQNPAGKVIGEYDPRRPDRLEIKPEILAEIKKLMVAIVNGDQNTGSGASVDGIQVAGLGGPAAASFAGTKSVVGWFAGFAPADRPKYAFAACYEGAPNESVPGGASAAPMIGKVLRELFADESGQPARPHPSR